MKDENNIKTPLPADAAELYNLTDKSKISPDAGKSHVGGRTRLSKIIHLIMTAGQLVREETDEQALVQNICEHILHTGTCKASWIGYIEEGSYNVLPVAQAGLEQAFLSSFKVTWDDSEFGCGPAGIALKTGKSCIMHNITKTPEYRPWQAHALELGYRSAAAFPLICRKNVIGTLNIYSSHARAFSHEEVDLLSILSDEISAGIEKIRNSKVLNQSEMRYHDLYYNAPVCYYSVGTDGLINECNKAAAIWTGYSTDELSGMPVFNLYAAESKDKAKAIFNAFNHGIPVENEEMVYMSKDGRKMWGLLSMNSIEDEQGHIIASRSVVKDITAQKTIEQTLKASEEKYATLVEKGNDGILVIQNAMVIFANSKMLDLCGFSSEEVLGKPFTDFIAPEYRAPVIERYTKRMRGEEVPERYEIELLAKDGRNIPVEINASVIDYEGSRANMAILRDMTMHKHMETTLGESEKQFRALYEDTPVGYITVNAHGQIATANKAMSEITGYSIDELVGRSILELHADSFNFKAQQLEIIKSVLSGKNIQLREARIRGKNGKTIWVSITLRPVFDIEGRTISVRAVMENISKRKKFEQELLESEEKLRLMFESLTEGITMVDLEGKIVDVNRAALRMHGYRNKKDLIGRNIDVFIAGEDQAAAIKNKETLMKTGYLRPLEHSLIRKDGSIFPGRVRVALIKDQSGKNRGVVSITEDITYQKQSEKALKDSEGKYSVLFESTAEGILIANAKTREFQYANPAICKMLGYTADELVGMNVNHIHPEESLEYVLTEFDAQARGEKTLSSESPLLRKDGRVIYADINTTVTTLFGEECNVGFFTDVTQRKIAEDEKRAALINLLNSLRATVEALATTVELRDPYTAGHQVRVAELSSALAEELGFSSVRTEAIRMAAIIHDIGKIYVPAEILNKPGKLSELEYDMVKTHPQAGFDILKNIDFPAPVAQAVMQHHERLDGSGYPAGLSGQDIIPEARILAVADVVEAMASHRPYRPALGIDQALTEISHKKGAMYDPEVVDACCKLFKERGFTFERAEGQPFLMDRDRVPDNTGDD